MKDLIKVWWHCLINIHCKVTVQYPEGRKHHWCECGYNNDGVTWVQMKAALNKAAEMHGIDGRIT